MSFTIPLFELNFDSKELEAIQRVIQSKWISMGPECLAFEKEFASALNVRYAITLSNCTCALHLALLAAGINKNDEVICPSLTFAATVNAIHYVGATPVFADIVGDQNLNINPDSIRRSITKRTKAIIIMHYAGFPCDMEAITQIAKEFDLQIIEDACHAPLSLWNNQALGTFGTVGCFSFFSNKSISTGEGGMLITNNEKIYKRCHSMRSHGMTTMSYQRAQGHATSYDVNNLGYNYRMDDMRAALGRVQLKKLEKDIKIRAKIRAIYLDLLAKNPFIKIPFSDWKTQVSNYIFPIILTSAAKISRDHLRDELALKGIQTSFHYPPAHQFTINQKLPGSNNLPVTESVAHRLLTLPMHSNLTEKNLIFITKAIQNAF